LQFRSRGLGTGYIFTQKGNKKSNGCIKQRNCIWLSAKDGFKQGFIVEVAFDLCFERQNSGRRGGCILKCLTVESVAFQIAK
jgi:hypothetical protein